jgi:hypothetical protein
VPQQVPDIRKAPACHTAELTSLTEVEAVQITELVAQ